MSCSSAAALSSRSQMRPSARSAPLARQGQNWTMAALAPGLRRFAIVYNSGANTRGGYSDTLLNPIWLALRLRSAPLTSWIAAGRGGEAIERGWRAGRAADRFRCPQRRDRLSGDWRVDVDGREVHSAIKGGNRG